MRSIWGYSRRMDFQSTLFEAPASRVRSLVGIERRELGTGAWIDVLRTWLPAADEVFARMVAEVPWRAERRQMYDRVVDVPRLVHTYMIGETLPHPVLTEAREALSDHYRPELGEPFRTAGCCYYRDGRDSVAWHGDTLGRGSTQDTMVAIVSLGDPRRLCLRPRGGGESVAVEMGHGDLLVMGGRVSGPGSTRCRRWPRPGPGSRSSFGRSTFSEVF